MRAGRSSRRPEGVERRRSERRRSRRRPIASARLAPAGAAGSSIVARTVAGRGVSSTTRSATNSASSTSWVTRIVVRRLAGERRHEPGLKLGTGDRVERGERLVEEQDRGAGEQRPGERHPLSHPARELARVGRRRNRRARGGRASPSRASGSRPGRGRTAAARPRRCRRRASTGSSMSLCGIQVDDAIRVGRRGVPGDRDRPGLQRLRARRSARAASTCRNRRHRPARASRRVRRRGRFRRGPRSGRSAWRSPRTRDAGRLRRSFCFGGSRGRGWLPLGDDDLPFARITAQVRRVSAGRGGPGDAISARCPRAPLDGLDHSPRPRPGQITGGRRRRRSARGASSSSTRTPPSCAARRRPSPSRRSSSTGAARG